MTIERYRREPQTSFAGHGGHLRVDALPARLTSLLEAHGIGSATLDRLAGEDRVIRGGELDALAEEIQRSSPADRRHGRGDVRQAAELYAAIRTELERSLTTPAVAPDGRPVGIGREPRAERIEVALEEAPPAAAPAPAPVEEAAAARTHPPLPEAWEGRARRVGGRDVVTTTVLSPAVELRAAQMLALPAAEEGRQVPVRAYVEAMAARDHAARLAAEGHRRAAAGVQRPEGVPTELWNLTRALERQGLSARDVEHYLVTGQLPDLLDEGGEVVQTGVDRLAALERAAVREGSWTAVNSFTFLVGMRRSAMAAERQALAAHRDTLAPDAEARVEIDQALAASQELDRALHRGLQSMYRSASLAREASSRGLVRQAGELTEQASAARERGDAAGAADLERRAEELRSRGARRAHAEAEYRAGVRAFDPSSAYQLAARAQVDTGLARVDAMRRQEAPLTEALPAELGAGDGSDTASGVPGAARLLADARRHAPDGGHDHGQLGLETAHQGAVAAFHQLHVERSGYLDRVGADGARPAARTDAAGAHRQAYLDARVEQGRLMMERVGLYGPPEGLSAADAAQVAQLSLQHAGVMQELGSALGTSLSSARQVEGQRQLVDGLTAELPDLRAAERSAREQAATQREISQDQRDATDAIFGDTFKTSGEVARDRQAVIDANAAERLVNAQVTVASARTQVSERALADARDQLRGLEVQAGRDADDARRARAALARLGPEGRTRSVGEAYERTRALGDASAERAELAIDRAEDRRAGHPADPSLAELASRRVELARYHVGVTELDVQARGEDGREGATQRLDRAAGQLELADQARIDLDFGSPERLALAAGLVEGRAALAQANGDHRPAVSRAHLAEAEELAYEDLALDPGRQAEAFARVGVGATQVLLRQDGRFEAIAEAGAYDGAALDAMDAQARRLLGRDDLPGAGPLAAEVRGARTTLERIDRAFDAVPTVLRRSAQQIENGAELTAAQVGSMGRANGTAGAAKLPGLGTGAIWLVTFGQVDLKEDVQQLSNQVTQDGIRQERRWAADGARGAEDLAAGFERARAAGQAWEYAGSLRILAGPISGPPGTPEADRYFAARDFVGSHFPADRRDASDWAAFSAQAWHGHETSSPLASSLQGPVIGAANNLEALGDPRLAVVTDSQATLMRITGDSLRRTTENMGWIIAINTALEVGVGIVATGGLGSAASVARGGQALNAGRTGLQAAETAATLSAMARASRAVAAFRAAHPVLHTAAVTTTVGAGMAGVNIAAGHLFGRNTGAARAVEGLSLFVPIGASHHAMGLAGSGRRAAILAEEAGQLSRLRHAVSGAALREALAYRNVVAHARFYGPQLALGSGQAAATVLAVPPLAEALGVQRSELAQAALGVFLGTFMATGAAGVMHARGRSAQSARAAEQLVASAAALREAPLSQGASAQAQRAAARSIDAFQSRTSGRLPTGDEVAALRAQLARDLGVDPRTPVGAAEVQLIEGVVEAMRVGRASELGLAQAVAEHRTREGAPLRDRAGVLISPDEVSPRNPPTPALMARAVELAGAQLHASRGGDQAGASRALAYRDAAQHLGQRFRGQALEHAQQHGRSSWSDTLLAAEGWAHDRAVATELTTRFQAPRADGQPPLIGAREAARLEPALTAELGQLRARLDATEGPGLAGEWSRLRTRLTDEVGLSPEAADATVRTLQAELFDGSVARHVAAAQARSATPLGNAELGEAARSVARRMGYGPEQVDLLAREVVSARPRLEEAGIVRPGGETLAQAAQRRFTAEHPDAAPRLSGLDADGFVRAFGEAPDHRRLAGLAEVDGFAELAARSPERARALVDAPSHLDVAGVARRHGIAAAELHAESPAALALLLRAEGDAGAAALLANPAAARARAAELVAQHRTTVDPRGALDVRALSGAESGQLLARARFPERTPGATLEPLGSTELAAMGLEPRWEITVEGTRMALSEPFDLGSGRRGMVAFIEQGGEVHAQIFYRSNSQSAWRTSDASWRGHFGKGLGEADTALPMEVTAAAHRMATAHVAELRDPGSARPRGAADQPLADRVFRGLTVEVTPEAMGPGGAVETHGPHYYTRAYGEAHQGHLVGGSGAELPTHNRQLQVPDPRQLRLPPEPQLPDFTRAPEDTFRFHSPAYEQITGNGELTGSVYRSRDGSLRYMVLEDAAGRASIVGAERVDSPLTRWGNRRDFVELHGMDAPLFEYAQQIATPYGGEPGSAYRLNWRYARETPLVQELYRQRGMAVPEAALETSGRPADPVVRAALQNLPSYEQRAVSGLLVSPSGEGEAAVRARAGMTELVARRGEEGGRALVRMVEHAGTPAVLELFAGRTPRQIERHLARVTPEVLRGWLDTPPVERGQRMQADFARFDNLPPVDLRRPAARHNLTGVRPNTLAKERNTVIAPGVDVAADVRAINEGLAVRRGNEFEVNGRTYGFHDGTLYPIRGEGFFELDRGAFRALGLYNQHGGDTDAARAAIAQNRLSEDAARLALEAYRAGQVR